VRTAIALVALLTFAQSPSPQPEAARVLNGHFKAGGPRYEYLPFELSAGTESLSGKRAAVSVAVSAHDWPNRGARHCRHRVADVRDLYERRGQSDPDGGTHRGPTQGSPDETGLTVPIVGMVILVLTVARREPSS